MHNYFLKIDMQNSAMHQLPNEFTGSRYEFFRDQIVNLRLMFVNFALLYPFNETCYFRGAKKEPGREAARLAYFTQAATNAKSGP